MLFNFISMYKKLHKRKKKLKDRTKERLEAKQAMLKRFGHVLAKDNCLLSAFYNNGRRYTFVLDFNRLGVPGKEPEFVCSVDWEFTYFFDYAHPIRLGYTNLYTWDIEYCSISYRIEDLLYRLNKKLTEKNEKEPNNWKVLT